jgi:hypothetical protein
MNETINILEKTLGITFSDLFHQFWETQISINDLNIIIEMSDLRNGEFADVGPHPEFEANHTWLIRIANNISKDVDWLEMSLAHEILHLVLYEEGYPAICSYQDKPLDSNWEVIAKGIHSILTHPLISQRMRDWGFPVDDQIRREESVTLEIIKDAPDPETGDDLTRVSWILTYICNRLDGGNQICDLISRRSPSVANAGEQIVKWLLTNGYSSIQSFTSLRIFTIGEILLRKLNLKEHLKLCVVT